MNYINAVISESVLPNGNVYILDLLLFAKVTFILMGQSCSQLCKVNVSMKAFKIELSQN